MVPDMWGLGKMSERMKSGNAVYRPQPRFRRFDGGRCRSKMGRVRGEFYAGGVVGAPQESIDKT
jgi:hypothetical protein